MDNSTEISTESVVLKEEPECMEITPLIEHEDFIDAAATSLLSDSTAQNPYAEQMLKDGLSYADIDYFIKSFSNINNVKFEKIHCTCCNKHIGTAVESTERYTHPLLQVIICENCYMFYCSGDFETDKDGSELYCRWCGEGGQVFCCSKCPYVFCKKCISRNLGKGMAPEIECMDDWLCFNCNPCQISKQRATCWAINKYAQETKDLSEFSPNIKSQMFMDFSTCCKSKRALAKAGILPTAKRQKTESPKLKQALQNDEPIPVEDKEVPVVWQNLEEPQDEVICTPDILPFEESPPSSPPTMAPMEYAPPPGIRGLNAPPNVPVVKRAVMPKVLPKPNPVIKIAIPPKEKQHTKNNKNSTSVTKVANVVPTTQKITVPVQRGVVNSDEQWFGTAVIRSAEVTEYISSKVSMLAFMNSNDAVTNDKREEIYRSFQSHLDIAIAKLKNIKQNMTSSYKRLLAKQTNSTPPVQPIQPKIIVKPPPQPVIQPVVLKPPEKTPPKPIVKPMRTSTRKKSVSYVESSTDDEEWRQTESDEDYSSGSNKKKYRKKKTTPKKQTPEPSFADLIKPVDISSIVPKPIDNKIILDVIDLVDDDSNDGADNTTKDNKVPSEDEQEIVPDIDSDISEILPDHLVETELSDGENKTKNDAPIQIDDDDKNENSQLSNKNEDTQSTMPKSSSDNENSQEKVSNIDSCSNLTNISEKNGTVKQSDDNSNSHKFSDINKNKKSVECDDSTKKDESENEKDIKLQNGDCTNSPKVQNDLSDNAVDNDIEKNGKKPEEDSEAINEDFETFLSSSVIKNKSEKDNYGDEFSKFVTNSKSSLSEEDIEDVVNNMYEQTDDALSLPPQNSLDFAIDFKDDIKKKDIKNEEKTSLENELNVLRKLAENCISSDTEANV